MVSLNEWRDFAMAWRFSDPKYNEIPIADRAAIRPLTTSQADAEWRRYVSADQQHLATLPAAEFDDYRPLHVDWNDPINAQKRLRSEIAVAASDPVTVFWSPLAAAETDWTTFLRYWDDFCYPDDEIVLVLPSHGHLRILYSEERFLAPAQLVVQR
jgi:hypothetical protein